MGARLCTVAELQEDETRGSDCSSDNDWVWTAESCGPDHHMVAVGSQEHLELCADSGECDGRIPCVCNARCKPHAMELRIRCCADVDPNIGPTCVQPKQETDDGGTEAAKTQDEEDSIADDCGCAPGALSHCYPHWIPISRHAFHI